MESVARSRRTRPTAARDPAADVAKRERRLRVGDRVLTVAHQAMGVRARLECSYAEVDPHVLPVGRRQGGVEQGEAEGGRPDGREQGIERQRRLDRELRALGPAQQRPPVCRQQVLGLTGEPRRRLGRLPLVVELRPPGAYLGVVSRMTEHGRFPASLKEEPLAGVFAHAAVEGEAKTSAVVGGRAGRQQRAIPQRLERLQAAVRPCVRREVDDRLRRVEVEAPRKNRELREGVLLPGIKQLPRGVDRRSQRGVPRVGMVSGRAEQVEAARFLLQHLGRRERPRARRGQLDGEGDPVEAADQLEDIARGALVETQVRPRCARAIEEQAHGVGDLAAPHHTEGPEVEHRLALDAHARARGHDPAYLRRRADPRRQRAAEGGDASIGGVQDDESLSARGERCAHRGRRVARPPGRAEAERPRHGGSHGVRIRGLREIDPPGSSLSPVFVEQGARELGGQAGLPHPRRPQHGHEGVLGEEGA